MRFEEKLVDLRKSRGISQEQLAEALGVSRQAVSRWESGDSTPDMTNLLGLCQYFGVSADYLIFDERDIDGDRSKSIPSSKAKNPPDKRFIGHLISSICFLIASVAYAIIAVEGHMLSGFAWILCIITGALCGFQFYLFLKRFFSI